MQGSHRREQELVAQVQSLQARVRILTSKGSEATRTELARLRAENEQLRDTFSATQYVCVLLLVCVSTLGCVFCDTSASVVFYCRAKWQNTLETAQQKIGALTRERDAVLGYATELEGRVNLVRGVVGGAWVCLC